MEMEISHEEEEDTKVLQEVTNNLVEVAAGPPHEAIFLVLSHLSLFELLSICQVCKSLKDALENDILPWLNIFIDKPLNLRVSDYSLLDITSKANGRLKKLALIACRKITDVGLLAVVANNRLINKLYVPGCTSLTAEGVIRAVEMLRAHSSTTISLKVSGIYNINSEDLDMLRALCQSNQTNEKQRKQKRNFYQNRHKYLSHFREEDETNPTIDIDTCPRCSEVRMVFDCPKQTCRRKTDERLLGECRACHYCIPRCEECGRCVVDSEEKDDAEAACADILCMDCWLQLPKCNNCNKPYCNLHVHHQHRLPGVYGFVCEDCYSNFIII